VNALVISAAGLRLIDRTHINGPPLVPSLRSVQQMLAICDSAKSRLCWTFTGWAGGVVMAKRGDMTGVCGGGTDK
jgi:hypothetical protein